MKTLLPVLLLSALLSESSYAQLTQPEIQFWRPYDTGGMNVFETGKTDSVDFEGIKVRIGGAFTQQFQILDHFNEATPVYNTDSVNINRLQDIGAGFNLATANLNLDVQLADGIRLNLVTYLSSRHHSEAWVKGGFIQVDKMKFLKNDAINKAMEYLTFRVGHMEINYGDAHFRRTDNGNAFYNPFVGNYIMDAFTTEIGGEVYFRKSNFLLMGAITGGEIKGDVTMPDQRDPSFYGKIGCDKPIKDDLRIRLTASGYRTNQSISNTLYGGDRAGSRYYLVMENTLSSVSSNFTSGRFNPGFRDKVTAFKINPFVKWHGMELFGTFERASGRSRNETEERTWTQFAVDGLYRLGKREQYYIGGRYNRVSGELSGVGQNATIDRFQIASGWYVTKNIMAKVEYVNQNYNDFPTTNILHKGRFDGFIIEGVVAF